VRDRRLETPEGGTRRSISGRRLRPYGSRLAVSRAPAAAPTRKRSVGSAFWHTVAMTVAPTRTRELRRDAQLNRERILVAARTLLARDGVDASVEDITRTAGVGM